MNYRLNQGGGKVKIYIQSNGRYKFHFRYYFHFIKNDNFVCIFLDVDECARGTDDCKEIAMCVDTPGSYICSKQFKTYTICQEKIEVNKTVIIASK